MQPKVVGVVIAADAIPLIHREDMMRWLLRPHSKSIPLLVADLSPSTSPAALREWSRGRIEDVQACGNGNLSQNAFVHIDRVEGITVGAKQSRPSAISCASNVSSDLGGRSLCERSWKSWTVLITFQFSSKMCRVENPSLL